MLRGSRYVTPGRLRTQRYNIAFIVTPGRLRTQGYNIAFVRLLTTSKWSSGKDYGL